jgi:hypothetical protein
MRASAPRGRPPRPKNPFEIPPPFTDASLPRPGALFRVPAPIAEGAEGAHIRWVIRTALGPWNYVAGDEPTAVSSIGRWAVSLRASITITLDDVSPQPLPLRCPVIRIDDFLALARLRLPSEGAEDRRSGRHRGALLQTAARSGHKGLQIGMSEPAGWPEPRACNRRATGVQHRVTAQRATRATLV